MNSVFNVLQLEQAVTFLTCRGGRFEKSTGSPSVPKVFLDIPQIISAYLGGGDTLKICRHYVVISL